MGLLLLGVGVIFFAISWQLRGQGGEVGTIEHIAKHIAGTMRRWGRR